MAGEADVWKEGGVAFERGGMDVYHTLLDSYSLKWKKGKFG
jgi:hypothetical protein